MRYKEYNRIRLKHSLWYLGFYCTAFVYTGATLFQNRVDILGFRKLHSNTYNDISSDLMIGFMILFTFFLHSAVWEVLQYNAKSIFLSYMLLCSVLLVSFLLRILEAAFTLIAFISITQVSIESAKLLYVVTRQDSPFLRKIAFLFLDSAFVLCEYNTECGKTLVCFSSRLGFERGCQQGMRIDCSMNYAIKSAAKTTWNAIHRILAIAILDDE
ncbi:hypothetical protein HHI36_016560 [Cryptolaemus montrouzieri]|uniref:Uncharacterized protein n=1 Tax=Cryptolaemus montrouzieri TaxID=559131 RepID=A0ABD2NKI3_9CUCU